MRRTRAVFVGTLRGLCQLLVELVEFLAQAPDAFVQRLDVGIGDVLAFAFDQLEPRLVVRGMALLKVLEGVLGGAPAAENGAGRLFQAQQRGIGMDQRAGAPVAAVIPEVDVAQRESVCLALLLGGVRERLGLLEDAVALGVEGEIRG